MDKETINKLDVKKFQKGFLIFFISQIFLVISAFSFGANFKFLPSWLALLVIFSPIGNILVLIAMFLLYKYNKYFVYAFITMGIQVVVNLIAQIAETSTDDMYLFWSKGLFWSVSILLCIFYVYFFLGCNKFFTSIHHEKMKKQTKTGFIVFPILFLVERLLTLGNEIQAIKFNLVANRICLYGSWAMDFVIYFFVLALSIIIVIHVHKMRKEKNNNESETSEVR